MKVTSIKQQLRRQGYFSVFIDGKFSFSLSEGALLACKIATGDELSEERLEKVKKLSEESKVYAQTLRFIAFRPRSRWEIEFFLQKKKKVSDVLTASILNKLSVSGMIDDEKYAKAFVNDRRLLKPTSRRKLMLELRKKHIDEELIRQAVGQEGANELDSLKEIIVRKRRQTKYQDNNRLMRYLSSQGFNYGDIKDALKAIDENSPE